MSDIKLDPTLEKICKKLDQVADSILKAWSETTPLIDSWGWNFPAVSRRALAHAASELATQLRASGRESIDASLVPILKEWESNLEKMRTQTIQYFFNGHGQQAIPPYLIALSLLESDLQSVLGWQNIQDTNRLPAKLARRLRSYQAELDQIAPNKEALEKQLTLISDATSAAESLPTDLEALAKARKTIEDIQTKSASARDKIDECLKNAIASTDAAKKSEDEAAKLVSQCEEAYKITTTKGLAGAFAQRQTGLNASMWIWVGVLLGALGAGYFLGAARLKEIANILNSASGDRQSLWPNTILAFISLGAPIWLAWVATKQIGQRFRLAEDYAFKASVAKAYEGYRKEAARIDKAFESRLFESTLARLEEAPLRLVEEVTHGSPWHEFATSSAFQEALKSIPGFRTQVSKLKKDSAPDDDQSDAVEALASKKHAQKRSGGDSESKT